MSILSPSAWRFITLALEQGGDPRHQAAWRAWTARQNEQLPPYLAQMATHALSRMALQFEERIADDATDSLEAAQLENDLGYIVDIEEALLDFLHQPDSAYGP